MFRILTIGLFVLVSGMSGARREVQPRTVPTEIEELLWWLPSDTETVQVTQTPKNLRGPLFNVMERAGGKTNIVSGDVAFGEPLVRHLNGTRVKATVDGARRFRPPSGLGSTIYEGAFIVRFETPLGEAGAPLIADLAERAVKVDRFDGLQIVEFREKLEKDVWTFWITLPTPDLLVIATHRGYLEELLRRRKTKVAPRAIPDHLPEWRWVDVTAPFWALRHYRRDAPEDPTSPFARRDSTNVVDGTALGVVAHVHADGRTIVAHYVSDNTRAEQMAREMWYHPRDGVTPAFRSVGSNAIEARLVAKDEEQLRTFFFFLMAALGHAMYI